MDDARILRVYDLCGVPAIAAHVGKPEVSVRRYLAAGQIPGAVKGDDGRWRADREALDAWLVQSNRARWIRVLIGPDRE